MVAAGLRQVNQSRPVPSPCGIRSTDSTVPSIGDLLKSIASELIRDGDAFVLRRLGGDNRSDRIVERRSIRSRRRQVTLYVDSSDRRFRWIDMVAVAQQPDVARVAELDMQIIE